tara:strand:+ start:3899 stop:4105 length:207 start_codon:yes stop_codon:yes gene_type:complete
MLKFIIAVLALAMLVSLFSSAFFLLKDKGNTVRAIYSLRVRVTIAMLLLLAIGYGLLTGQLGLNSPWG